MLYEATSVTRLAGTHAQRIFERSQWARPACKVDNCGPEHCGYVCPCPIGVQEDQRTSKNCEPREQEVGNQHKIGAKTIKHVDNLPAA